MFLHLMAHAGRLQTWARLSSTPAAGFGTICLLEGWWRSGPEVVRCALCAAGAGAAAAPNLLANPGGAA